MRIAVVAGVAVFAACLAQAQPPEQITVTGTVVNSVTGLPIPRALVTLNPGSHRLPENFNFDGVDQDKVVKMMAPDPAQRALTDQGGRFSFNVSGNDNPPQLEVKKVGYRSETHLDTDSRYVPLDRASNVTVKLVPLSAIQGRVLDEDGQPVEGATVETIQIYIKDGMRQLWEDAYMSTDDRGEYRLWDLSPGPVYLRVVDRYGTSTALNAPSASHQVFSPVYYPAASTRSEAQALRIHPGETVRADFVVERRKGYQIRGTLGNIAGIASAGTLQMRLLAGEDALGARAFVNPGTGDFQILDVVPGSYTLQAFGSGVASPAFGQTPVMVEDRDVSGIVIPMATGVDVKGKIEFPPRLKQEPPDADSDPGDDAQPSQWAIVQVRLNHAERLPPGTDVYTQSEDEESGNFVLKNLLPGNYSIDVTASDYVVSVQSGLIDVLRDGLTVSAGAPPELKIVLGAGGGTLACTIEGLAAKETALVVLVRKHDSTNLIQTQTAQAEARAMFYPLAPGQYTVYAWPATREVEYRSPTALAALAAYGVPVEIQEGSDAEVTVKLAPGDESGDDQ
jgi:hypothetical protein